MKAVAKRIAFTNALVLIVVTCLVAGCRSGTEPVSAPELPTAGTPAAVEKLVSGPEGQTFLRDIISASWGDDGQRAGELFAWIPRDARSTDSETSTRAGHTANAIASFIADNKELIKHAPANSVLWQSFSQSLEPYLGAMMGADESVSGFTALDSSNSEMRRTAAVFAAMHKDPEANRILTAAADVLAHGFEATFAEAAAADPSLAQYGTALDNLQRAARLRGLVSAGAHLADQSAPIESSTPAQTEVMYQVARLMARPDDPHLAGFFRDGQLLPPGEVAGNRLTTYDTALSNYLATWPHIRSLIDTYGRNYAVIADQ